MSTQSKTPDPAPKRSSFLETINADVAARGMLPPKPGDDAVCTPDPLSEDSVPREVIDEVELLLRGIRRLHNRVDADDAETQRQVTLLMGLLGSVGLDSSVLLA